jgi:uncharacterized protein YegP (UPF0339 family)
MSGVHEVQDYKDEEGAWRWRVIVTPGTPAGTEPDIIAISSEGYENRGDMLASFFGVFFGEYNESFLSLYNQWDPENNKVGS